MTCFQKSVLFVFIRPYDLRKERTGDSNDNISPAPAVRITPTSPTFCLASAKSKCRKQARRHHFDPLAGLNWRKGSVSDQMTKWPSVNGHSRQRQAGKSVACGNFLLGPIHLICESFWRIQLAGSCMRMRTGSGAPAKPAITVPSSLTTLDGCAQSDNFPKASAGDLEINSEGPRSEATRIALIGGDGDSVASKSIEQQNTTCRSGWALRRENFHVYYGR